MVGQTLAHYKILDKIGSGGMGEVYLAHDAELDRKVALKILPPDLSQHEERRARFKREAKAIASLNHPNIVTIHSVEECDSLHFITMELVKGRTLSELISLEGLSLDAFFDMAIPLADAVAAAHARGIVHRDLKPGNVMVTEEGRLKVLDFGLAKPMSGLSGGIDSHLPTEARTDRGVIVGTVSYMSPEQAQGKDVDARSDIFSLGIVLYEMLTGRRPFEGETSAEILSSIIKEDPPAVSGIRSGLPRELSRMVRRCLSKDPSRRAQSALDIRNELEELRRELDSGELLADARPAREHRSSWGIGTLSGVAGAALLAVVWRMNSGPADVAVVRLENPVQITSAAGVENHPTLSPDGGRIAFDSDQSGNLDIWVTQVAGGGAVNLTADHPGLDRDPAWSPDGSQIAFVSERDGGGVYVIPAIGGRPNRISARRPLAGAVWSADGSELACIVVDPPDSFVEVVSLRTRESHQLMIPGSATNRWDLSWSSDGRFFAYVRAVTRGEEVSQIWVLRVSDGQALEVTDGVSGDWSPMWSKDTRTLFYLSNRSGSMDLWEQRIAADGRPDGDATPITVGIGMQHASLTPDGNKLVYSRGRAVSNVWRVPILEDREAVWDDAEQITFDEALIQSVDLSRDGERLVFSSDRGGRQDLWVSSIRGDDVRQLTADRVPDRQARWSPDGRHIAYSSYDRGNWNVWVMPLDGGPAVPVTRYEGSEIVHGWSPDGSEIAFHGDVTDDGVEIYTVPSTGGEARQLTTDNVRNFSPQWSPDGEWIVFSSNRGDGVRRLWRTPASGGTPELVTEAAGSAFRFSPHGTSIYYKPTFGTHDFWVVKMDDGVGRRAAHLSYKPGRMGDFAVGKEDIYFAWGNDVGDIWVMDLVRDED